MTSSSEIDAAQKLRDSDDLLKQGDAALDKGDIETAIQFFGSALEARVSAFGELGSECAVAYFKYGSALFAKAQRDTDVLGPAGQKLQKERDEVEEEDVEGEADESSKSKGKGKAAETEGGAAAGDASDAAAADAAGEEDLEGGDEEEEEDEGDQELAWRLLETARCIYAKRETRTLEEADVIATLADISLEKEEFDACLEDYQHALQLLGVLVSPHHRRAIELYFKMALANQTGNRPAEALRSCRDAIDACQKRIELAQSLLEKRRKQGGKEGGESNVDVGKTSAADTASAKGAAAAAEGAAAGAGDSKDAEEVAGEESTEGNEKEEEKKSEATVLEGGKEEAEGGGGKRPALDKGKGKVEEAPSTPYDTIDEGSSEEQLLQEIEDVQQIICDLKDKAEELQEMIRMPSVEAMLRHQISAAFSGATGAASSAALATAGASSSAAAAAASTPAVATDTASPLPAAPAAPAAAEGKAAAAPAAAGCAAAVEGEQRGEKRAAEVVVVGRGKKRATPVAIPPEEAAVLSWPGVAS